MHKHGVDSVDRKDKHLLPHRVLLMFVLLCFSAVLGLFGLRLPIRARSAAKKPTAAKNAQQTAPRSASAELAVTPSAPTFNADIAPILFARCASCHRPGQVAPFPLLTYADASRRAQQIAIVTTSRYMPPWKPEPIQPELVNASHRRLTTHEIALLKAWANTGMREGDPKKLLPHPRFTDDWTRGKPDLIVTMPKPYTLTADTIDVYRSFVIPTVLSEDKWIQAVEFRPSNRRIVRDAVLYSDISGTARKLEAGSGAVGYSEFTAGMEPITNGSFTDWSPGAAPFSLPAGFAERLPKGADLVLQLRFRPDGRKETEQTQIGLYFAPRTSPTISSVKVPILTPAKLLLGTTELYLQPGKKATVTDAVILPCAVHLLKLAPHLHATGRTLTVKADLPDGSHRSLLTISDWDINWRESYVFAAPMLLPAGTKITFEATFNNTADNPRNPHSPPHRIGPSLECQEEMATLGLIVVPIHSADQSTLAKALQAMPHRPAIVETGAYIR